MDGLGKVVKLTPEGKEVTFTADSLTFTDPRDVAVDGMGYVYVSDAKAVVKLTLEGEKVDNFPTEGVTLPDPRGVAVDGYGNVYVADKGSETVVKLTPEGKIDADFKPSVTLPDPFGVAVDGYGNVYVGDNSLNTVVKLTPEGENATFSDDGVTNVKLSDPKGVAVDGYGNVYVANRYLYTVVKFTHEGEKVDTLFKKYSNFFDPFGVAVDGYGNVYVACEWYELGRQKVVMLTPEGKSDGRFVYAADKLSFPAQGDFTDIWGVAVDGYGNVYVVDRGADKVVKLNREGS